MTLSEQIKVSLLEKLAKFEHQRWSHWFLYHDKKTKPTIGYNDVDRWYQKQADYQRWLHLAETPYAKLTEKEKKSDREWASKVLAIIKKDVVCTKLTDVEKIYSLEVQAQDLPIDEAVIPLRPLKELLGDAVKPKP